MDDDGENDYSRGVSSEAGPERAYAAEMVVKRLRAEFANAPAVLAVINGYLVGSTPAEICEEAGLTKTQYDSAVKRLRRWTLTHEAGHMPESIA